VSGIGSPRTQSFKRALEHPLALLVAQAAGLWPIWQWYMGRLREGTDERWGVLALGAALVLLWGERGNLRRQPQPAFLLGAGLLTLVSAVAAPWLSMFLRAMLAVSAVGLTVAAVLGRPGLPLPLWVLFLLSLPVVTAMQLQFYLGYPLRALTAWASRNVLAILGLDVTQAGTVLTWMGRTVLVDAPCSGIRMLWVGMFLTALLSYLMRASVARFTLNAIVAFPIILAGNVLRTSLLFIKEARIVVLPAWTHEATGLLTFLLTSLLIVGVTRWRAYAYSDTLRGAGCCRGDHPRTASTNTSSIGSEAGG
jgi:exosortase